MGSGHFGWEAMVTASHMIQGKSLMEFLFTLNIYINMDVIEKIVQCIYMELVITFFTLIYKGILIIGVTRNIDI